MSDKLAKYELHACNDILFVYNFIVKMPPFYPTNPLSKEIRETLKKCH